MRPKKAVVPVTLPTLFLVPPIFFICKNPYAVSSLTFKFFVFANEKSPNKQKVTKIKINPYLPTLPPKS
jgi:hypothetical protein